MGHLMRSLALTRSLSTRFDVTLVSGGELPVGIPLPAGVRIVTLPAVGLDAEGRLVCRDRRRSLQRTLDIRRRLLLDTCRAVQPRVAVIELFPFGRRKFRGELEPLLTECRRNGVLVCCSVRDILVGRDARQRDHDNIAVALLRTHFDLVLVHSDPTFTRLESSISSGIEIPVPTYHTGFVHDAMSADVAPTRARAGTIVVSAGGGMVGLPLLRATIDGHALLPFDACPPLTVVAGPYLPAADWRELRQLVARRGRVRLLRSVPSLAAELRTATGSISQCGYNTAMDIIRTGVRAVVVPFGDDSENEQLRRARRLEEVGAVRVVLPSDLSAYRMADELRGLSSFTPVIPRLDLNGAERSTRILEALCDSHHSLVTSEAEAAAEVST
jgi:predicted glycosyltransferase